MEHIKLCKILPCCLLRKTSIIFNLSTQTRQYPAYISGHKMLNKIPKMEIFFKVKITNNFFYYLESNKNQLFLRRDAINFSNVLSFIGFITNFILLWNFSFS